MLNVGTRLECRKEIILENKVLIAPQVYISDRNHAYQDVKKPIIEQGYYGNGTIKIQQGAWIGIHSVILGGGHDVTIGKGTVVGANTVVTNSLPNHCVVAGETAKIIK